MRRYRNLSRRQALKLALGAAAPMFIPARLLGAEAPSKQITMGCIGIGWMGEGNLNPFLGLKDCRVLAVADVDASHLQKGVERVNDHYKNKDCKGYKDFREL